MANDMILREDAKIETRRLNYAVISPFVNADGKHNEVILKREVDFGMIPNTKRPTLFKSGAEAICKAYGVFARYERKSAIEQTDPQPFFYYSYECKLVKIAPDGREYVLANGFGNANTGEGSRGLAGAYSLANTAEKKAQKRALVAAAISLGGLSSMFFADLDDTDFVEKGFADAIAQDKPEAKITAKQVKRLFAVGADVEKNNEEVRQIIIAAGYSSTKDIIQADYDDIILLIEGKLTREEFEQKKKEREGKKDAGTKGKEKA